MEKRKILLVDDEELILVGWQETLETAGYHVRTALSGKKAVEMAKEEKPDIVITDLVMAEMNGVDVCREIKKTFPDVDVLLVSGHPDEIRKCQMDFILAGGKDVFLRKPLLDEELVDTVKSTLSERF